MCFLIAGFHARQWWPDNSIFSELPKFWERSSTRHGSPERKCRGRCDLVSGAEGVARYSRDQTLFTVCANSV